ncbi:MAG: replicative DNA helicase [Bacteroidetes bacterium]|jgi:replicative DNA helicase|nr:replicative DNA helicase [Bacteroidota bacterium]MBT6685104.1 replicative DNA helicase [Bacteroidota bacterium]MBT7141931.1 replicative DNA helicase [Bacteroidota bacterium]MBT7491184.1 replicative DNA helicase [Bacteroidota bacterium]
MSSKKSFDSKSPENQQSLIGKLPPQAVDVEEVVLGALMLESNAIDSVIELLKPESFYKEQHQKIYKAIFQLASANESIDILTVTEQLRRNNELDEVGGPFYITQLTSRIGSAAHVNFHARIVVQKYIQRELIRVSSEIQRKAYDENNDILELLNFSESELFKISEGNIKKETQEIKPLVDEAIKRIEEAGKNSKEYSGVPSGFTNIDRITSGWQKSDLIIIAARPSMGKTAFILSLARNISVELGHSVAIFSLEMSAVQLVNRLIVSETELASEKIRNGKLEGFEWEQLEKKISSLQEASIFIDDTPAISIFELRAKCRRLLKQKKKVELIMIDYLQLMTAGIDMNRGNREQEVSIISRSLKALAKELDVPIIALSQLNRGVEARTGIHKRPMLSDLRESGAIEQDADMVVFIHRPEYYGLDADKEGNSLKGVAEIIIAKHRNGATETVNLKFLPHFAKFVDVDFNIFANAGNPVYSENTVSVPSKFNSQEEGSGTTDNFPTNDIFKEKDNDQSAPF